METTFLTATSSISRHKLTQLRRICWPSYNYFKYFVALTLTISYYSLNRLTNGVSLISPQVTGFEAS